MEKIEIEIEATSKMSVSEFAKITRLLFTIKNYESVIIRENDEITWGMAFDRDPITNHTKYEPIKNELEATGTMTVSEAQRKYGVGYNKATEILDYLCEIGVAKVNKTYQKL